uniref:t-SNARE coiled-coil homology domain-containing protein n=1 Tax=Strigamia maritima TaxID=126957 RepID=T1IN13_STRMM
MAASCDRWILDYENCEKTYREVLEKINQRDGQSRVSQGYAQVSSAIRLQLKKFETDLIQLRQILIQSSSSSYITELEIRRRETMLDNLEKKHTQLQAAFANRVTTLQNDRSALLNKDFSPSSATKKLEHETDDTRYMTVDEIKNRHAAVLEEQDRGLDALSQVIARQKNVGYDIANEIDIHNDIIDDITDHVDRTRERLIKETGHVKIVHRKSGSCWLWTIILLLIIAIVLVSTIPAPH